MYFECTSDKDKLKNNLDLFTEKNRQLELTNHSLDSQLLAKNKSFDSLSTQYESLSKEFSEYKKQVPIVTSGYLEFYTPKKCDGNNDDKDGDTKIVVSVTGSHGTNYTIAYAESEGEEFNDDDSYHIVPLTIKSSYDPNSPVTADHVVVGANTISLQAFPKNKFGGDGRDTWIFKVRAVFKISDGTTRTSAYSSCITSKDKSNIKLIRLY